MTAYFKTQQKGLCLLCIVACTVSGAKGELKAAVCLKILHWEGWFVFFIESIKLGILHSNFITPPSVAADAKGRSSEPGSVQSTYLMGLMLLKSGRLSRVSLAGVSSPCWQGLALPWRNQRAAWTASPFLFLSWGCQQRCQADEGFCYVDTSCQVRTGHRLFDSYLTG